MMIGRFEGRPVYRFAFGCKHFYVTRGDAFLAAVLSGGNVAVLAPPGTSYRQAASRAFASLRRAGKERVVVADV